MRSRLLVVGLALALGVPAALVAHQEHVLASGRRVLLRLAPVDPRSLIQGDYMDLRYAIAEELPDAAHGLAVLALDAAGVAIFARQDDGRPLAPAEVRLRYRRGARGPRLGAEAFFFQEGKADRLARARYGELRVAPSGESVLVGLCDEERRPLARSR